MKSPGPASAMNSSRSPQLIRARPLNDVDHAFDRAVMVRAGLGLGMDDHGAGPQLFRAGARLRDRGGAVHTRRLRGVDVEFVGMHDAHAVQTPFRFARACIGSSVTACGRPLWAAASAMESGASSTIACRAHRACYNPGPEPRR